MTVETEDQTTAERALGGEQIEGRTIEHSGPISETEDFPVPPVAVERRAETWVRDDTRRLVKVGEFLRSRNVDMLLACPGCREMVKLEGYDNGGAALMGCGCAVRRWV